MAGAKEEKTLPGEQREADIGKIGPKNEKKPGGQRPPGVS
jgi:hypothetical protein